MFYGLIEQGILHIKLVHITQVKKLHLLINGKILLHFGKN